MTKDITVEIYEAPPACAYKRCIHWEGKIYAIENSDHAPLVPGVKVSARIDEDGIATIVEAAEETDATQLRAKYKEAEETIERLRSFIKHNIIIESYPVIDRWNFIKDAAWSVLGEHPEPFIDQVLKILQSWGLAAKMVGDVSNRSIGILNWEICQREGEGWSMWMPGTPKIITLTCADEDKITPAHLAGIIADSIRDNTNV